MRDRVKLACLMAMNTIAFGVMIVANLLSVLLPLNGLRPQDVSALYPNLFTPAEYAFSIWGLIYVLVACFILYQFSTLNPLNESSQKLILDIGPYFIISSLANAAWIFAWHYRMIPLSVLLIIILLLCLIAIALRLSREKGLTARELLFIKLPFNAYLGWVTVATIANVAVLLVSIGWIGWGIPEPVWTVLALVLGLALGLVITVKIHTALYGLALVWGYAGILVRHVSPYGFNGAYPMVIVTAAVCIAFIFAGILYIMIPRARKAVRKQSHQERGLNT